MRTTPWKKGMLALLLVSLIGCGIPEDEHNAVLKDLEETKMKLADTQAAKDKQEQELKAQIADLEGRIAELEKTQAELQNQLDAANAELSMYESKTGGLEAALKTTKDELDVLRKQRMQAEKRLREYRKLAERLASMVESGKLSVKVRNGKMVIELSNNILFPSGKTDVKDEGQAALTELAGVLKDIGDRSFLVTGHTDNVPISNKRFDSNWELSTARAVNVVQYLQDAGVAPTQLAAAGYGEYDPVASNETDEGKALNRRIEIVLMPNLDELPQLPKDLFSSDKS
jgi:chemotaxis protein MotB